MRHNLKRRGIDVREVCPLCKDRVETTSHLFRDCIFATTVWWATPLGIRADTNKHVPVDQWLIGFLNYLFPEDGKDVSRSRSLLLPHGVSGLTGIKRSFKEKRYNPKDSLKMSKGYMVDKLSTDSS